MDGNGRDTNSVFDLLVVGGGITGAGIAQDAAARGIRTVLVDKGDFGCGTSSRSSKLIHGGLRYLEHFSLGLMRESIVERHTLARLAPGLVHWRPFLLPHYRGKTNRWIYSAGLWLYDHLARTPRERRHRLLGPRATMATCRGLRADGLTGSALYYDCVTDDARLVLGVMVDAQSRGAKIYNYTAAQELIHDDGHVAGARVRDERSGQCREVRARQVVVAAGPWTDLVLDRFGKKAKRERIRPAKGVHIVLERDRIPLDKVLLIPSAHDKRFLFVIPWYEGIVVGTTDTEYHGDPDSVRPDRDDVQYIIDALNWTFPQANVRFEDILSSYAGIRPLINAPGKRTADVPREFKSFEFDDGLICVAGGKLTTYRVMAASVVDRLVRRLKSQQRDRAFTPNWTHRIQLGNPPDDGFDPFGRSGLPGDVRAHLVADYGMWARQIVSIIEVHPEWAARMVEGLPYILAEAYFAITHENALTLDDILSRRTRIALLDRRRGAACAASAASVVAEVLGWTREQAHAQVESYLTSVRRQFPGGHDFA